MFKLSNVSLLRSIGSLGRKARAPFLAVGRARLSAAYNAARQGTVLTAPPYGGLVVRAPPRTSRPAETRFGCLDP